MKSGVLNEEARKGVESSEEVEMLRGFNEF
jgi:hypothetical protein